MRRVAAILLGKLTAKLIRILRLGGGSAAPGLYALKIYPNLVQDLARGIPKNVLITGTNGKTTTARMLAHLAREAGLKVIGNHTGSNLERGIASTLISASHLEGANVSHPPGGLAWHLPFNIGIWELDEAAFNAVAPKLKPDIVVFLNVFRDQLDRYGEVDSVVKKWCQTLKSLTAQTIVLVNGDDSNTARLKDCFGGKVESFGVEDYKIVGEAVEKAHHHKLDFEAKNVKILGLQGSSFKIALRFKLYAIRLPIPGLYHIYDALAALACAYHLGFQIPKLLKSLKSFQPAFGRVEKLPFGYIFLIKNPAGATQVFETVAPLIKPQDRLLLALNDNLADGRDVSWIWDANFEALLKAKRQQKSAGVNTNPPQGWKTGIVVSGSRAQDLAVRLKYAGFDPKRITAEPNLEKALKQARKGLQGRLFILPTYTAMLELQHILAKSGLKRHYWEES